MLQSPRKKKNISLFIHNNKLFDISSLSLGGSSLLLQTGNGSSRNRMSNTYPKNLGFLLVRCSLGTHVVVVGSRGSEEPNHWLALVAYKMRLVYWIGFDGIACTFIKLLSHCCSLSLFLFDVYVKRASKKWLLMTVYDFSRVLKLVWLITMREENHWFYAHNIRRKNNLSLFCNKRNKKLLLMGFLFKTIHE